MSGQAALNMTAYNQAAMEFNRALTMLVSRNWMGTSLDDIFNVSALLNSIHRLETSFQSEMSQNLLKMWELFCIFTFVIFLRIQQLTSDLASLNHWKIKVWLNFNL